MARTAASAKTAPVTAARNGVTIAQVWANPPLQSRGGTGRRLGRAVARRAARSRRRGGRGADTALAGAGAARSRALPRIRPARRSRARRRPGAERAPVRGGRGGAGGRRPAASARVRELRRLARQPRAESGALQARPPRSPGAAASAARARPAGVRAAAAGRPALRVVVLTTSYPRYPGDAAGHFVGEAVERLRGRGLDMHVVAPTTFRHYGIAYGDGVVGNLRRQPLRAAL